VLVGASGVSLLATVLFYLLFRSLTSFETARRQLDEIFNLSPDGLVSFDRAGLVKYASPAFLRMTHM
jgi:PAS domain-containing protein